MQAGELAKKKRVAESEVAVVNFSRSKRSWEEPGLFTKWHQVEESGWIILPSSVIKESRTWLQGLGWLRDIWVELLLPQCWLATVLVVVNLK